MDSLAGYESDVESVETGPSQTTNGIVPSPEVFKDVDTNYDVVAMDESDQEMNNNVEEYYSADVQEGVNPEDAPLVFRTITEPRNDIRTTPLHRSSSDMEVDDSDTDDLELEEAAGFTADNTDPVETWSPTSIKTDEKTDESSLAESHKSRLNVEEDDKFSHSKRSKRTRSLDEEVNSPLERSPSRSPSRKYIRSRDDNGRLHNSSRREDRRRDEKRQEIVACYRNQPSRARNFRNPILQVQKKKLIWGNKSNEVNPSNGSQQWDTTVFKNDFDGKMAEKFKRLMGIKTATQNASAADEKKEIALEEQEEMFSNMEAQYQQARIATHTQRGCGLGYAALPQRSSTHKHS